MIRSMTGFATHTTVITRDSLKSQITLTVKSLNSRYFEVTFRMPYQLSSLETELTRLCKQRLIRGHLYITVHVSNQQVFKGNIEPNLITIKEYISAINAIKDGFNLQGAVSLDSVLGLPNIFSSDEHNVDEQSKEIIMAAANQLIDSLIIAQDKEGVEMLADIKQRLTIIAQEMSAIEKASAIMIEAQKAKINQTIQELGADESKFADTQKNSLFSMLDKIDTHEEIIRFKSHLQNLSSQLAAPIGEKGKRLDFTLQELAREINTISAKCSDATIGAHAINIKVELEKAREQVQNIV